MVSTSSRCSDRLTRCSTRPTFYFVRCAHHYHVIMHVMWPKQAGWNSDILNGDFTRCLLYQLTFLMPNFYLINSIFIQTSLSVSMWVCRLRHVFEVQWGNDSNEYQSSSDHHSKSKDHKNFRLPVFFSLRVSRVSWLVSLTQNLGVTDIFCT